MLAYNERILHTSESRERRDRAESMIANLRPVLAALEAKAPNKIAAPRPPTPTDDRFESVWNGRESLHDLH